MAVEVTHFTVEGILTILQGGCGYGGIILA